MARPVERVRDERSVARPGVGVRVAGELRDVEVGGRDDRAVVVGVRSRRQDAAPVQLRHIGAELLVDVSVVLLGPDVPVGDGPAVVGVRAPAHDQVLAVGRDLAQARAHAQPVSHGARLHRFGRVEVEPDGAVHRALLDRVLAQDPVLGVNPRAGQAIALLAIRPGVDPELRPAVTAHQEVAIPLVSDDPAMSRIERDSVADVRTLDVPVVVKKDATSAEAGRRLDLDVANEPVARQVHVIGKFDGDPKTGMLERHVSDQRVLCIAQLSIPGRVVEPGESAVDEESRAADIAHRLVGVTDSRKVDIADRVGRVEPHQDVAISDDETSRHVYAGPILGECAPLTTWVPCLAPASLQSRQPSFCKPRSTTSWNTMQTSFGRPYELSPRGSAGER